MAGFTIVCAGQAVSLLSTAMTNFGITLWAYEVTGMATPLALVGIFFGVPYIVLMPFIGVLVDRSNRKLLMILSDLGAAITTLIVLILFTSNNLQIWHLYITAAISGIFQGFQGPAYSAAITTMMPKKQYTRANGMLGAVGSGSRLLAPMLAGALIGPLGLIGLLFIDLISAAVAIGTLVFVHVPQPAVSELGREERSNLFKEAAFGFRYIFDRPSLLGLQSLFMLGHFFANMSLVVLSPMVLGRTGHNEVILGSVRSVGAAGGLIGGLLMTVWGGPKRRIRGVLLGWFLLGLLGLTTIGLGQSPLVWAGGAFLTHAFATLVNSSNQAIWQSKVEPDLQGRVFSARRFVVGIVIVTIGYSLAGQLADRFLEPGMEQGGRLASVFGGLVGTGTGAGMALLFLFGGLMIIVTVLIGSLIPAIRNAEDILPDHDAGEDN